jgi:predicted nucleic acid-binding protein
VNVVDSSGWLEFFMDGPNASHFERVIGMDAGVLVPTLVVTEVLKVMTRKLGEEVALLAVGRMSTHQIVDLDLEIAVEAARIGSSSQLAIADSIILATARLHNATLWTQDADFEGMEGVQYFARQ